MLASQINPRRAGGPAGPSWPRRHAALLLAACIGWAQLPLAAIGDDRPSGFDPFDSTAARQAFQSDSVSKRPAPEPAARHEPVEQNRIAYDPFVTTAALTRPVILLQAERANDYDPFEAPGSTSDDGVSECKFQEREPRVEELIPPPSATPTTPASPTDPSTDAQWAPTPLVALTTNICLPAGLDRKSVV